MVNFEFGAGYLAPGTYRFTLTPVNYFRCSGSPLKGVFSVKKAPWRVVKNDPVPTIYTQKKGGVERSEMLNFSNSRCGGPDIGTACFYLSRLTISFAAASTSSAERPVL